MRVCALLSHTMDAAADAGPGEEAGGTACVPLEWGRRQKTRWPIFPLPSPLLPPPPVEHLRLLLVQALSPTSREDAATYPE